MSTSPELTIASNSMKADALGVDEQQVPQSSVLQLMSSEKKSSYLDCPL